MKKILLALMVFVLAFCLVGCFFPSSSEESEILEAINSLDAMFAEIEEGPSETIVNRIAIEPQTFEDQGVTVTLVGVEEIMELPAYFPMMPADGHRYVVFEFEIRNGNKGELPVSSMLNFIARMNGEEYIFSVPAIVALERDVAQLDFVVPAGESMNGIIGFELPDTAGVIEIEYHAGVYTNPDNTNAVELATHIFTYER